MPQMLLLLWLQQNSLDIIVCVFLLLLSLPNSVISEIAICITKFIDFIYEIICVFYIGWYLFYNGL